MGKAPKYDFKEFLDACAKGDAFVLSDAMETAERDFGLKTQDRALGFVADGGLESPNHANTTELRESPLPIKPIVDSYDFYSGGDFGYIAFWKNDRTGKWIIKSFKKNDKQDPRNFAFREAFEKASRGKKLKKREE